MQCHKLADLLSGYIDGMLEPSLLNQVKEHLAECTDCRVKYEETKAAVDLVKGLPEVAPPESFHGRLFSRLQSVTKLTEPGESLKHAGRRPFLLGKVAGVLAVAAMLLMGVGFSLWYSDHGELAKDTIISSAGNQVSADENTRKKEAMVDSEKELVQNGQSDVETQIAAADRVLSDTEELPAAGPAIESPTAQGKISAVPMADVSSSEGLSDDELADTSLENNAVETEMLSVADNYNATPMAKSTEPQNMKEEMLMFSESSADMPPEVDTGVYEVQEMQLRLVLNQLGDMSAWQSSLEKHGGFIQAKPRQDGGPWVLCIPAVSTEAFIDELNTLGLLEVLTSTNLKEYTDLSKITLYIG